MAITFEELAYAIIRDDTMTVTIVFYPTGLMHDLHYGELPVDDVVKLVADGHRVFTIQVNSSSVDRVELAKSKVNIIEEQIAKLS